RLGLDVASRTSCDDPEEEEFLSPLLWRSLRSFYTILSFLLSFLSSSRFSLPSSWAIRLNASARVARRQTISSFCAKDCLSRSATLSKRDPVSHSSISSAIENSDSQCCKNATVFLINIC
ncbi:hypothetical protein X777_02775, partial [Ooceraea biroi]